ncbi:MAG: hypothetical protein HY360_08710 [Verrucomicrobia bacterium]|nr:hypothetical protein [Verrucomicrobiota bacterium]
MKIVLMTALATACSAQEKPLSTEELFNRSNAAFVSGRYADAIRDCESLLAQGKCSAALLYNLANACFRDGKIGSAILNYERALWLAPYDADIRANLQFVRRAAGIFEAPLPWWQIVSAQFGLNTWAWLAGAFFTLLCGALAAHTLRFNGKRNIRPAIALVVLAWGIAVSSAAIRSADLNRAVVIASETSLRVAPLEDSPSLLSLAAGSVVRIQKQQKRFFFIRTMEGRMGWVSERQVQRVIPD